MVVSRLKVSPVNRMQLTHAIRQFATGLGFFSCGFSKAQKLDEEEKKLAAWLTKGFHGEMKYMENHFEIRVDPTMLVPGARTVISLLMNYYNNSTDINKKTPRISQYALGEDYHLVLKQKLAELLEFIQENSGAVGARMFVDSGPVLERAWAARSGTGWIGKNGMLLNREQGSFFFLAEIILDLELEYDSPMADFCGTCRACLDACPTQAILPDKQIDGSRCISYLTIELKNELPAWASNQLHGWMFGCDVCQDVCPWNRFAKPHSMENFFPSERLKKMKSSDWYELTREIYEEISRKSAMKRAKFSGLKRNLAALQWEEIQPRQSQ